MQTTTLFADLWRLFSSLAFDGCAAGGMPDFHLVVSEVRDVR